MAILAIDSGIEKTGYAIFGEGRRKSDKSENHKLIASGLVKTDKKLPIEKRLLKLHNEIRHIIGEYKPEKIILEQLFFFKNQKTFIQVSQAQGVVMLAAVQNGLELEFLTPLQIKQTVTGYGLSDKKSVHKMLRLLLQNEVKVSDDDESDAIACGLAYCILNKI